MAVATAVFAMSNAGIAQALLPVHAVDALMLDEAVVGFLISLTSATHLLVGISQRHDRGPFRAEVVARARLLIMAAAAVALTVGDVYAALLVAAVFIGIGEAAGMGTSQTFAMDMAPPEKRGMYLGLFMLAQSVGATIGPLLLTALYHFVFPDLSFATMAVLLVLAALMLALMARETGGRARLRQVDTP